MQKWLLGITLLFAFSGLLPSRVVLVRASARVNVQDIPPILQKIAVCESGNRQFEEDGKTVIRGRANPHDIGRWQINERWHLKESRRLGMDIYSEAGNLAYALHLYRINGTRDWSWSRACWSK